MASVIAIATRRRAGQLLRRAEAWGFSGLLLLARTFFLLLAAKLALQFIPVRRVIAWKQRPVGIGADIDVPATCAAIRRAILVVARHAPLRFVCFPQCLAAAALLRAKGIPSRLHYGVARGPDKLVTHTWLEAGGAIVIGGEVAADYSTLAVY